MPADLLKPEEGVVFPGIKVTEAVSHHVGVGKWTPDLWKSSYGAISLVHVVYIFLSLSLSPVGPHALRLALLASASL